MQPGQRKGGPTPRDLEVGLDFAREWIEFTDPADDEHVIRADLTWLLSRWTCIFGSGCHGITEDRAGEGCCSDGAYFHDAADQKRVRKAVKRLTRATWQHHRRGFDRYTEYGSIDGETPALRTATRADGPCVFLNDPDFAGGGGCALHGQALRDGVHPLEYKPDVCWQLPVRQQEEWRTRGDDTQVLVTTLGEFDRRGWGEGGHDLHWWCTSSPEAHVGEHHLYESYGPELVALVGEAAYARLAALCDARVGQGMVAPHPATVAAPAPEPVPMPTVRSSARRAGRPAAP